MIPTQMRLTRYIKLRFAHVPGMPGTFSPPPRVSDPDMHHGTCETHVTWCIPGSLTIGFLWNRRRGKLSRNSRHMRNPQFYVSGKRPMRKTTRYSSALRFGAWQILLLSTAEVLIEAVGYFYLKSVKCDDCVFQALKDELTLSLAVTSDHNWLIPLGIFNYFFTNFGQKC